MRKSHSTERLALFSKVGRVASENVVVELLIAYSEREREFTFAKNQMFSDIAVWYGSVSAYKNTNKFAKLCHL